MDRGILILLFINYGSLNFSISIFFVRPIQVYVVDEFNHYGVVVIRMVLSEGKAERFDLSQCQGLSSILTNKDLLYDPAMQQNWPNGTTYLFVMGDLQPKRSKTTSTTEPTEKSSMTFYEMLNMITGELYLSKKSIIK